MMMKCRVCGGQATIKLESYNTKLCERDFLAFFERRVKNAIKDFDMLNHQDRVLVAVSGGKDSLALWDVLRRLGYQVSGYHLVVNIPGSSEDALQKSQAFAEKTGAELIVENLAELIDADIKAAARAMKKPVCSVCGMVKRYRFNQLASEHGFTAVVTGHHLDDESATLLGNLVHWQEDYLARQYPVLPVRPGMVKKAKPLVYVSKKEIEIYARLRDIAFASSECPYAEGATSLVYKDLVNSLEEKMPSTKIFFLKTFFKKYRTYFKDARLENPAELHPCPECGYPTSGPVCNFCQLKHKLASRPKKP
jgi:uncharacterized protein (TIGR00269 family)